MQDVCFDVEVEPTLKLLQGDSCIHKTISTEESARLNLEVNGLSWPRFIGYFFDVRIFNQFDKSSPQYYVEAYKYYESFKFSKYEQRIIDVKKIKSTCTCFPIWEGAGPSPTRSIYQLASKIAEKKDESYSDKIKCVRTKINFALLGRALKFLGGCLGSKRPTDTSNSCSAIIVRERRLDS